MWILISLIVAWPRCLAVLGACFGLHTIRMMFIIYLITSTIWWGTHNRVRLQFKCVLVDNPPPPQPRGGWPHHRGLCPLLFLNSGVGSFTSHANQKSESAVRRDLRFSSSSEKTRKSNRLQMSLQRQHFLLSYFEDPECWSGRGLNPRTPAQQTGALPTVFKPLQTFLLHKKSIYSENPISIE